MNALLPRKLAPIAITAIGLALAGCSDDSTGADDIATDSSWRVALNSPAEFIGFANGLGFENAAYHEANFPPPNYISTGTLIEFGQITAGSLPNNVGLYVYGSAATTVDEIRFKFNVNRPTELDDSLDRFIGILEDVFGEFDLSRLSLTTEAVRELRSQDVEIEPGLVLTLARLENQNPGEFSLIVNFHRSGIELQPN